MATDPTSMSLVSAGARTGEMIVGDEKNAILRCSSRRKLRRSIGALLEQAGNLSGSRFFTVDMAFGWLTRAEQLAHPEASALCEQLRAACSQLKNLRPSTADHSPNRRSA